MSYFEPHYGDFRIPIAGEEPLGFRDAQRGALHSVAGHFLQRDDPAIVTMPTGSGKTAVLQGTAYLLRAKRALVMTPSRLVREQIAENFRTLDVLRRIGAVAVDLPAPATVSAGQRVSSLNGWEALREYDVVVATVPSISPAIAAIPEPPADLFDLVLVDEAHHSPAATWTALLEKFGTAKRVLFTATPYRRDEREIKGRFVFTYDLRRAYEDGVFGQIHYEPVADVGDHVDIAIARAAEACLQADRAKGFAHLLMVRTDSRVRAKELEAVYARNTGLRLSLIQGTHSLQYVKRVIAAMRKGELDGIICINMLGEGFDFPNFKIAAIHSPHRSLAVTLQFIGRFARTSGENLGRATFIAAESSMEIERQRLLAAGAVWQDIIPDLSAARVRREEHMKDVLHSFETKLPTAPDLADLSLYTLTPYAHAKIYALREDIDFSASPRFPAEFNVVFGRVSEARNTAVYITREVTPVAWSTDERLVDVAYDLFVFHYDHAAKLLFICASRRADGLYAKLAREVCGYDPRILSLSSLNRALSGLEDATFFNIGMRNRQASSLTESYRIVVGSAADKVIMASDGRLYHRGHCFGKAKEGGVDVTIGLSSSSKAWSNASPRLDELIAWFSKWNCPGRC